MSPVKRFVCLSIATGLAIFTVVGSRVNSQQAVLAQDAALPQQRELIAQRQSRIALVIGNAAYDEGGSLANPVNDATDIAKALEELGFEVTLRQDLNKREMEEEIEAFSRKLRKGSVGVFYYAGHGVQMDGENYLVPLKARLQNEKDVRYDAVPLGKALNAMESAGNQVNIAIIDACRDNPFYRRWNRTIQGRGLTSVSPPSGIIIAYATRSGNVAADGTGQRNSPFTSALLENIKKPNLDVQLMFRKVSTLVREKTEAKQEPWTEGNLFGDSFYLNPKPESTSPRVINSPTPKPSSIPPVSTNLNTNSVPTTIAPSRPIPTPTEIATSTTPKTSSIQSQSISDPTKTSAASSFSSSIRILNGHSWIESVAISPDGKYIVSGNHDKTIDIWNLETGKLKLSLTPESSWISNISISPDGENIVSGIGADIKIWNLATGELKNTIENASFSGDISSVTVSPDGKLVIAGNRLGFISILNLATGGYVSSLGNFNMQSEVSSIAISPDGERITNGNGNNIEVWNKTTKKLERTLKGHSRRISSITISPNGQKIISASHDKNIKIWDLETGELERTLEGHADLVASVAISPNGQKIISASHDKSIKIWDLLTGNLERTLTGHSDKVLTVAVSPNGKYIISGSSDKDIRVWQLD